MYLYVVGSGHSGSTILDILLGNSSQIESVGELFAGLNWVRDNQICSCGMAMPDCPYWREIQSRVEAEGISWGEACAIAEGGLAGLWRVWHTGKADPVMARRAWVTQTLARAITTTAGKPHLLDSSKTPGHGLLLLRHLPEARLIHLVRDPRQILRSFVWRIRTRSELNPLRRRLAARSVPLFLLRMAAGWTVVNLLCDLMARAYPGRVVQVRFEDLCAQPAAELERIGRAFGLDLADLADLAHRAMSREPLAVGHNIGGNHLRHADAVRFDPGGGRRELSLPRWLALMSIVLCGPVMWRHGYRLDGGAPRPARSTETLSG